MQLATTPWKDSSIPSGIDGHSTWRWRDRSQAFSSLRVRGGSQFGAHCVVFSWRITGRRWNSCWWYSSRGGFEDHWHEVREFVQVLYIPLTFIYQRRDLLTWLGNVPQLQAMMKMSIILFEGRQFVWLCRHYPVFKSIPLTDLIFFLPTRTWSSRGKIGIWECATVLISIWRSACQIRLPCGWLPPRNQRQFALHFNHSPVYGEVSLVLNSKQIKHSTSQNLPTRAASSASVAASSQNGATELLTAFARSGSTRHPGMV